MMTKGCGTVPHSSAHYKIDDIGYLIKLFNVIPGYLERVTAAENLRVRGYKKSPSPESKTDKPGIAHLVCLGDYDLLTLIETKQVYDVDYVSNGELKGRKYSEDMDTRAGEYLLHSSNLFGYRVTSDSQQAPALKTLDILRDIIGTDKEPASQFCLFTFMKLNNRLYEDIYENDNPNKHAEYLTNILERLWDKQSDKRDKLGLDGELRVLNSSGLYERIFFLLGNNLQDLMKLHLEIRKWKFNNQEVFSKTYTIPAINYELFHGEHPIFSRKSLTLKAGMEEKLVEACGESNIGYFYFEEKSNRQTDEKTSSLNQCTWEMLGHKENKSIFTRIICSSLVNRMHEIKAFFKGLQKLSEPKEYEKISALKIFDKKENIMNSCTYELGDKDVCLNVPSEMKFGELLAAVFTIRANGYSRPDDQRNISLSKNSGIPRYIPVLNTSILLDFNIDVASNSISVEDTIYKDKNKIDNRNIIDKNPREHKSEGIQVQKLLQEIRNLKDGADKNTSNTYRLTLTRLTNMIKQYNGIVEDPTKRDMIYDMLRFFRIIPKKIVDALLEKLTIEENDFDYIGGLDWNKRVFMNHYMLGVIPTVIDSIDWGLRQRFEGNFPTTVDYITGERGQTLRGGLQKILIACNVFMREYVNDAMEILFINREDDKPTIYNDKNNFRSGIYEYIKQKEKLPDSLKWSGFNTFGMTKGYALMHYEIIDYPLSAVFAPPRWLYGLHEGGHLIWSKVKYNLEGWIKKNVADGYLGKLGLPKGSYERYREERIVHEVMADTISYALGHKLSWRHYISAWAYLAQSSIVSNEYMRNWNAELMRTYFVYYLNSKIASCVERDSIWEMAEPDFKEIYSGLKGMEVEIVNELKETLRSFPTLKARDIHEEMDLDEEVRIRIVKDEEIECIAEAVYNRIELLKIIDNVIPIQKLINMYKGNVASGLKDYDDRRQEYSYFMDKIQDGVILSNMSHIKDSNGEETDLKCIDLCHGLYDWTRENINKPEKKEFYKAYLAAIISMYKKSYQIDDYKEDFKKWKYLYNIKAE